MRRIKQNQKYIMLTSCSTYRLLAILAHTVVSFAKRGAIRNVACSGRALAYQLRIFVAHALIDSLWLEHACLRERAAADLLTEEVNVRVSSFGIYIKDHTL